jgi:hypothetical protein
MPADTWGAAMRISLIFSAAKAMVKVFQTMDAHMHVIIGADTNEGNLIDGTMIGDESNSRIEGGREAP